MKCPGCKSKKIIKRGRRKGKFGSEQLYCCKDCGRRFAGRSLEHKMYPARVIYNALNYYNLGYTFDESSRLVNKKYKVKTSKSTVHLWINEFQGFCPISTARDSFSGRDEVLFTKRFEHENLDYEFMYHKYKLDVLVKKRFPGLAAYITRFENGCPDVFFEVGERCSKPSFEAEAKARKTSNLACRMAGFAVQAATSNREKHKLVERFMLINDKATVACEIPVWYWEKNIDTGITGHIDILQVRNDLVYILDYKPAAEKQNALKVASQLYQYASALSFRTRVPLKNMRCAWFDEESYYEYSPSEANITPAKKKGKR
jgi:transposase-like protein